MIDRDDLPPIPTGTTCPRSLRLLARASTAAIVTVICEDGVGPDALVVVVPSLFAHARRVEEGLE